MRWKPWRPRTLLARLMLLIALLLVVGQYAAFRVYDYVEREPRAAAAAFQAISVVNLTQAALFAAQEDRRLPLLEEISRKEGVRIYPVDIFEVVAPLPNDPQMRRMAELIRQSLGPDTLIAYNHLDLNGLWVSFMIDEDAFWVVIPNIRVEHTYPRQWLGWAVLIFALSLAGAYLIAHRINRPLQRLAAAADQIAQGQPVEKLPEDGAEELQRVNHTFNAMTVALAQLDEERTLLLAGVSHDLRTPLARLRLSVEMLPDQDSLKPGMVQDIRDMDDIIRQFLDFIRGVAGEVAEQADLNALITEMAERYARNGQPVKLTLEDSLPLIPLRRQAMMRLLGNLIDNAFKYGGGQVSLEIHRTENQVLIAVEDHGPGIPEHEIARLLRPFERLNQARSGGKAGSGLGLAIAERITRLHHGKLALSNLASGGLRVEVTLPLA